MRKEHGRKYRHLRIRRKVSGTAERPRLCVFRSLKHLEVQLVDDLDMRTLVSVSTRDKDVRSRAKAGGNVDAARTLGRLLAEKAKGKGVTKVVFDRAGYLYQGRVRALADAAREGGLSF